jgi:hypothetical protein
LPLSTLLVCLLVSTNTGESQTAVRHLKEEVSRIYEQADLTIRWVDSSDPQRLTIILLPAIPPIRGCESAFGCSVRELGKTPPTAFVATQAIWNYERPRPLLRGRLLAFVVAHELGHLIGLPHGDEPGLMFRNTGWFPHVRWTLKEKASLAAFFTPATPAAQPDPSIVQARPEVVDGARASR